MRCLIVDDDPLLCDLLSHFCDKLDQIEDYLICINGLQAVNMLSQEHFDIVLLDYNLPDLTGRELLSVVPDSSAVIMITSDTSFAPESYSYDFIIDYLVKPIEFSRFAKAINKAIANSSHLKQAVNSALFVKDGNRLIRIRLDEILFIKSEANYIKIVTEHQKIMSLMALRDLEQKLHNNFQRIHRSYIINIDKIDTIEDGSVIIKKNRISITESYKATLMSKINLLN